MSRFVNNQITDAGMLLLAKAQVGRPIVYTKILIGDGLMSPDQNVAEMTDIIHQVAQVNITKCLVENSKATIGGPFPHNGIQTGFFYRELALYALDPDVGEILYSYGNSGEAAEWIPITSPSELRERFIEIVTTIGNATNISAIIDSMMYATIEMLNYYSSQVGQLWWDASEIQGENTLADYDLTANKERSVTLDGVTKSLNGVNAKKKIPFGEYIAIFRVKSNEVESLENVIACEIMPGSGDVPIASRSISPAEFQIEDTWAYFKIPFEINSVNNQDKYIYPKVTYLSGTTEIKVDNVIVASDILAIM